MKSYPFLRPYLLWCGLLSIALLAFSCNKDEDVGPGFDLQFQRDFTVPPGIDVFAVHHFTIENIPTHFQDLLTQNQKTTADIARIITTKAVLTGVFGDADYDFVDQVSVRAFDKDNPTNFLEVAYRQPVPLEPGNTLPLIPSLADSKQFLSQDRANLDVVLWVRNTTREEMPTRLTLTLRAEFK